MQNTLHAERILSIDIGGSHIKATMLNEQGTILMDYENVETPKPATPASVLAAINNLVKSFPPYDKISAGFPGYVKEGIVQTAPNLDNKSWQQFNLLKKLSEVLGKPARVVNDADMLSLGVVSGKGLEMLLTLGTGFGTALLKNGSLLPHIELAHHPITKNKTYDEYVGDKAFKNCGIKKWNKRIKKVIAVLKTVFNYDLLYIGGGNAANITFKPDRNITIVTNKDGIDGGARLWKQDESVVITPQDKNN